MGSADWFVVLWIAAIGLALWALVDIGSRKDAQWPDPPALSRTVWLFLVLVTGGFGAVAYLLAGPPARLGPRRR
jgi:hypothetical protein